MTKLKRAVLNSGMKQKWIAEQIGICEWLLSRYVTGERKLPVHRRRQLAKLLGVAQKEIAQ